MKAKISRKPSLAKSMVMVPLYAPRVVQDRTQYRRKPKHAKHRNLED
ncbi:hypothetical protein V0M98_35820 (plasmid) [Pseudomonas silesiensis]